MPESDVTFIPEDHAPAHRPKSLLPWLLLALVIAAVVTPLLLSGRAKDIVAWNSDFADATLQARTAHKPVLVNFTAEWCPPCQDMKREVYSRVSVKDAIESQVIAVKIDLTDPSANSKSLAMWYRVEFLPTIIIVDADGKELSRREGFLSEAQMLEWLQTVR